MDGGIRAKVTCFCFFGVEEDYSMEDLKDQANFCFSCSMVASNSALTVEPLDLF